MNLEATVAKEVIRDRTSAHTHTLKPRHPRTARVLRRFANRLEGGT
ncbi:MAG: hypothetical protein ACRDQA_13310 [Nocardioidaceae bacterium]